MSSSTSAIPPVIWPDGCPVPWGVCLLCYYLAILAPSKTFIPNTPKGPTTATENTGCPTLHCTTLHYTALHCTTLIWTAVQCTTLHCTTLHCTSVHCTAPHYTAPHYTAPHYTAPHYSALHNPTLHLTTPQWTVLGVCAPFCPALLFTDLYHSAVNEL